MIVVTIALLNSELFQNRHNQSDQLSSDLTERKKQQKKKKKKKADISKHVQQKCLRKGKRRVGMDPTGFPLKHCSVDLF
jgi:hypothetical protein